MTGKHHQSRSAIEAELLDWMCEPVWADDAARFETLALRLFAFQFEHCDAYARYCAARDATPRNVSRWFEIPPVPTSAFKAGALTCFDAAGTVKTFHTSGTTTSKRGALHLDTLALYEASLLPNIRRFVFPEVDCGAWPTMSMRVLAPDPMDAPDSSLSHMFGVALEAFAGPASGYDVRDGVLESDALIDRLKSTDEPLALCGTAFAFVHLLEALDGKAHREGEIALPGGSRIMETGGFKGRSREVPQGELYESLSKRLGIPDHHIVNQYGMTELGSQFYDNVLFDDYNGKEGRPRQKVAPPWTRIRLLDPETGERAREGEAGIVVIHDLANTGSIAALQTADLGRWVDRASGGFEVLGRAQGAEARGCSIAADERWQEAHR
ncbi:MAG: long-chain fatty acid--CoA ligase [Myxococcota bacterium]|nr:long-chain fatty acid--CoA ligase [Myxococcota bacterium]